MSLTVTSARDPARLGALREEWAQLFDSAADPSPFQSWEWLHTWWSRFARRRLFLFLDHDLHPEHYHATSTDDERTGYAIASWLGSNPDLQRASTILVHTRNADGAMRMVEELRRAGRAAEYVPFPMLADRIRTYWQR